MLCNLDDGEYACLLDTPPASIMAHHAAFDVDESLKLYLSDPSSIPTPEAEAAFLDYETDPEGIEIDHVNAVLDPIVDAITESSDAILQSSFLDSIQCLLKCVSTTPVIP